MKCYLAGHINEEKITQCVSWRNVLKALISDIEFLDPLAGENLNAISGGGNKGTFPTNTIVARDLMFLKEADIIIANLDNFDSGRPPIGTLFEIAFAHLMGGKPIIIISDKEEYTSHPFIQYCASAIVDNLDKAINVLRYFTVVRSE